MYQIDLLLITDRFQSKIETALRRIAQLFDSMNHNKEKIYPMY